MFVKNDETDKRKKYSRRKQLILCSRAVAMSENPGGLVVLWWA